jgi:hypothetical protein
VTGSVNVVLYEEMEEVLDLRRHPHQVQRAQLRQKPRRAPVVCGTSFHDPLMAGSVLTLAGPQLGPGAELGVERALAARLVQRVELALKRHRYS